MFERFNDQSRRAIVLGQEEAARFQHNYIGTEHLLAGLAREKRSVARRALESAGITLDAVRGGIETVVGRGQQAPPRHIPFTPEAKKSLELSLREAMRLGHNYIGTGHLLLGLISVSDSAAVRVLGELGTDIGQLRARAVQETQDDPEERDEAPALRLRRPELSDMVLGLLDSIDDRLTAIERHLGISRPAAETGESPAQTGEGPGESGEGRGDGRPGNVRPSS
jgi:ATP-dependent Clp protease ATP-binding subunit ClpC